MVINDKTAKNIKTPGFPAQNWANGFDDIDAMQNKIVSPN